MTHRLRRTRCERRGDMYNRAQAVTGRWVGQGTAWMVGPQLTRWTAYPEVMIRWFRQWASRWHRSVRGAYAQTMRKVPSRALGDGGREETIPQAVYSRNRSAG